MTDGSDLPAWPADLLTPPFAAGARPGLLDVIAPLVHAPTPGRDLIILVDGLGADLLAAHRALVPTLRRLEAETSRIRTVTPATTASAMASLHTGAAPLEHGILGYTTRDPATDLAVNQLTGDRTVDPHAWMPLRALGESTERPAIQVGPGKHHGSHLSAALYRGWEFLGHGAHDRVDVVLRALRNGGRDGLVHLHVDDVDHAGHRYGVDSDQWRTALAEVDGLIGTLLRRLPGGTRAHITADHGMLDTSPEHTVDLSVHPGIMRLVKVAAGEARALALTAIEGATAELGVRLGDLLGERALVLERRQYLAAGIFGPPGSEVSERVNGRLPDLLVLARGHWGVDDYSRRPDTARAMIGVHGSLTPAEGWVPLIRTGT